MTENDKIDFTKALTATAAVFAFDLTEAAFTGYWLALQDLEYGHFQAACVAAMKRCQWMPRPVEIREFAGTARRAAEWRRLFPARRDLAAPDLTGLPSN